MKAIVDGYDSSFANEWRSFQKKQRPSERLCIYSGERVVLYVGQDFLHTPPIQKTQYVTNAGSSCVSHMKARTTPCTPHLKDNTDLTIEIESPVETGLSIIP